MARRTPMKLTNYIDGMSVPPQGGKYIENINPANGQVVNLVPSSDVNDVNAAVAAAKRAYPAWRKTPATERAAFLHAIAKKIEERAEELISAESTDMGKPVSMMRNMDLPGVIADFNDMAKEYLHCACTYRQNDDMVVIEHRDPIGVVGLITPWNFPLLMVAEKVAPAIMCGNTCVLKVTELAPTTTSILCEIIHSVGIPKGVFNVVHGYGPSAGEPLILHKDVRAISFTGGVETGRRVATLCGKTLKKVLLELGGKNPTIVFDDAYLDETVQGAAFAGLCNTGQVCISGSRLLIQKGIAKEFKDKLIKHIQAMYLQGIGDPSKPETVQGPLVSADHLKKIERYVQLAKKEGGKILCGGKRPANNLDGYFYEPTIIDGLSWKDSRTANEEIFGPVITIHEFSTEEEAVEIANHVDYGLSSSVWTSDVRRGQRVARQIESGMCWINTWAKMATGTPFGGVKNSGVGRTGGKYSIEFYSEIKPIVSHL